MAWFNGRKFPFDFTFVVFLLWHRECLLVGSCEQVIQKRENVQASKEGPIMNKGEPKSAMEVRPYSRVVSLTIRPEHVFHFPQGLPAFEDFKNFVFAINPDTSPFVFMHSLNPGGLTFVCMDPFLADPQYAPRISGADQEFLRITKPESLMILSIVTVRKDARETSTNLQAPLAINIESSIGKQIMCDGQSYPVRFRIWDALERAEAELYEQEQEVACVS